MKKMTTLCLALALTCATEAGATTDKQPKLKGSQTAAWGVAVPGSRTQSASAMRFLNMGLGAPMAAPRAVGNDPVSSVTTPGFGWADGPDGNQWYYTQNYKLDGYFYSGSTITLYDNNNQQVGQFDIDVPDTLQVNSIEMYSALTKKMFDRDDTSIEAMVSIHAVGNAENNYKDCYITRAYHIDGSGIAYECEGSGMLFDASKGRNTYQRLILPIPQKAQLDLIPLHRDRLHARMAFQDRKRLFFLAENRDQKRIGRVDPRKNLIHAALQNRSSLLNDADRGTKL